MKMKKAKSGSSLGMKSVKAGYDKNPGVTRADIIVAAKKKARGGAKMKKAQNGISDTLNAGKKNFIVEKIDTTGYGSGRTTFPRMREIYKKDKQGNAVKKKTISVPPAGKTSSGDLRTGTGRYIKIKKAQNGLDSLKRQINRDQDSAVATFKRGDIKKNKMFNKSVYKNIDKVNKLTKQKMGGTMKKAQKGVKQEYYHGRDPLKRTLGTKTVSDTSGFAAGRKKFDYTTEPGIWRGYPKISGTASRRQVKKMIRKPKQHTYWSVPELQNQKVKKAKGGTSMKKCKYGCK